jgi:hypothetical protein
MSHEKFKHHERVSAFNGDDNTGEAGFFDVLEDETGIYVFNCGAGMVDSRHETVEAATEKARELADAYDAKFKN